MPARYKDWINQAKRDLESSINSLKGGYYEWSCFSAQQAAEKAVKSIFMRLNKDSWGHSVSYLLIELSKFLNIDRELVESAKQLDKDYIQSRYPNGFDIGSPFEYYSKKDAEKSIKNAKKIIEFCESIITQ
jgi:HEPN domain-containing protein